MSSSWGLRVVIREGSSFLGVLTAEDHGESLGCPMKLTKVCTRKEMCVDERRLVGLENERHASSGPHWILGKALSGLECSEHLTGGRQGRQGPFRG